MYTHSNSSHRIQHYFACYDSLQYPLLFPRGESGWHYGIPRSTISHKRKRNESDDDALADVSQMRSAADLIDMENEGISASGFILILSCSVLNCLMFYG